MRVKELRPRAVRCELECSHDGGCSSHLYVQPRSLQSVTSTGQPLRFFFLLFLSSARRTLGCVPFYDGIVLPFSFSKIHCAKLKIKNGLDARISLSEQSSLLVVLPVAARQCDFVFLSTRPEFVQLAASLLLRFFQDNSFPP